MSSCILHELVSAAFASGHIHQQLTQPLGGSHAQRRLTFLVLSLHPQQKAMTVLPWTPMSFVLFM